ncbi:MAG: type II toxin-antitoxin system HicB family antitoxin [Christensenellaceae bacterium]|nr:type II toxin-antitoxin system HicB family antitoxin [Christensenellaceae bacterium]
MKYVYPAYITKASNGIYTVVIPDIEHCITRAYSLYEAIDMAEDLLSLFLTSYEDDGKAIPEPNFDRINKTTLIKADTAYYRRKIGKKSVNLTVSLPEWLKTEARQRDVNFSQIMQIALKKELGIGL